jgi:hypothetical protein
MPFTKEKYKSIWIRNRVLLLYLLFFSCFFLQLPLAGSLPQNIDSWFNLAIFNDMRLEVISLFTDQMNANAFHPFKHQFSLGEQTIAASFIYNLYITFLPSAVWSFYLLIVTIYSLNAFAVYKYIVYLQNDERIALILGLCFATSNYLMALIDNVNTVAIFPLIFAICYFHLYLDQSRQIRNLTKSAFFLILSIYFSIYTFLFTLIVCFAYFLAYYKQFPKQDLIRSFWIFTSIVLVGITPYFIAIHEVFFISTSYIPFQGKIFGIVEHSIQIKDFLRALPENIIIPPMTDISNPWRYNTKSIYVGFSIFVLGILGLNQTSKRLRNLWLIIMTLSFIISLGPVIVLGNSTLKTPLYYLYKYFPLSFFLRNVARFYTLVFMGLIIFSSFALKQIKNPLWLWFFLAFFLFENLPIKLQKFSSKKYISPPVGLVDFFQNKMDISNIMLLPSSLTEESGLNNVLNYHNREYIYWNWKTKINQNIVNGLSGYLPYSSVLNHINKGKIQSQGLESLISFNKLDYVVYCKEMLTNEESDKSLILMKSKSIKAVYEDEQVIIFKAYKNSLNYLNKTNSLPTPNYD